MRFVYNVAAHRKSRRRRRLCDLVVPNIDGVTHGGLARRVALEALRGDRAGQYSIRINDQWRVCFRWQDGDVTDVEIVDYH